jgi:regulator of sigma E protease
MQISSFAFTVLSFAVALGVLVFVHELGHFMVAKRLGVKVLRFSIGFGPVLLRWQRGETEYALSAFPLGGYVKMLGEDADDEVAEAAAEPERAFSTQVPRRRAAIVFAGPAMNFVFAFLTYALLFLVVGIEMPSNEPRVGGVTAGLPAERAGLQVGDRITAVNGTAITTWEQLSRMVVESKGAPLTLRVERDGTQLPVMVTPTLHETHTLLGEPAEKVYRIGIEASHEWEAVGPVRALTVAAQQTWTATSMVAGGLVLMVRGRVPLRELGGPIAIARAAGQQARAGIRYFLSMLAFLSINLGVLNLLPVPALDGGHLAFFAVEGLMRRPLRPRQREIAQQVGLLVLITLMVFVFYNDIHRLVQG